MLSMNVGHEAALKLLERPPSKKVGSGLAEMVAAADVDDAVTVVVLGEVTLTSVVVGAVDTGIAIVSVTEPVAVLFLSSCSSGCIAVHFPSSQSRVLVSIMSPSSTSGVDNIAGTGVGCGAPSRPGSFIFKKAVGSARSSSFDDANTVDVNNKANPSALAKCVLLGVHEDDVKLVVADEPQQAVKRVNEAMIISWQPKTCGTCRAVVFGDTKVPTLTISDLQRMTGNRQIGLRTGSRGG